MPATVKQKLLCLSLLACSLAAPFPPRRDNAPQLALSDASSSTSHLRARSAAATRQWNVLYPRPPGQNLPQAPLQDEQPSSQTAPFGSANSTSPFSSSTTPALLPVPSNGTGSFPSAAPPQPSGPFNSSAPFPSTSGFQTAVVSPTSLPLPAAQPGTPSSAGGPLRLSLVNNLNSNNAHAYVSAIDSTGRVVMLTPSGSFYYLPETSSPVPQALAADIAIPLPPQGQSLEIAIPGYVEGARVWFADGTLDFAVVSSVNGPALVEPTAVRRDDGSAYTNWGFVELTYVANYGLFANLSFVDFVGLPLGMQLQTTASGTQTVPGMPRDAVQQVCSRLREHRGKGARHWADLCVLESSGNPIRVISPAVLMSQQPNAFPAFFQRYVDKVWEAYAATTLTINTQNDFGDIVCQISGDDMNCAGDNRPYTKPGAVDIFGCDSGPFSILESDNAVHRAVVPRLCAAFNRGTFLLEGGNIQPALPPSSYYTSRPHNLYSAVIHEVELEGRGYAFSYDDVTPSQQDGVAGIVSAADPSLLTVFVGGM